MSRYKAEPIDLSQIATYPLSSRPSKVTTNNFAKPLSDNTAASELRELAGLIRAAKQHERAVIAGLGGHVIKTGLAPILIDLMQRGYVTALVMNGSAMIHDFEIALVGSTSEDVDATLGSGT